MKEGIITMFMFPTYLNRVTLKDLLFISWYKLIYFILVCRPQEVIQTVYQLFQKINHLVLNNNIL